MIKLSRLADYAVVIVSEMALTPEALHSAQSVSERTGLALPTVSKILKSLAKSGIVTATRGSLGGYTLARPAAHINVAEVIEAIDGPIAITACSGHPKAGCDREKHCTTRSGWRTINARIHATLAAVSLAELQSERSFIHA